MKVLQKNLLTLSVATALLAGPMVIMGSAQADDLPPAPPGPYAADGMKELDAGHSVAGASVEMKVPEATVVAETPTQEGGEAAPEAEVVTESTPEVEAVVTEAAPAQPAGQSLAGMLPQQGMPPQGMMPQQGMPLQGMMPQQGMPPQGMMPQQGMMPGYPMQQMPMMYGYPQYYQPRPQVQYIYVVPMMMTGKRGDRMTPRQMMQMQKFMQMQQKMGMHGGAMMMPSMMEDEDGHSQRGRKQRNKRGDDQDHSQYGEKHHENDGHGHADPDEISEKHHKDDGHDHADPNELDQNNQDASQEEDAKS